ncbi:hypothetical protein [Patulibacter sp. SYSU D01012]|uniref:hypothetical protein n=1 Tax=Patulibacter sp. SYSU D01012 TaxID=2817381 RepID=UPI001B314F06|nr:hypothetical protein [Patulibacter sp. SYSU D01012]
MSARAPVSRARALAAARADPGGRAAVAALLEAQFHHLGRDAAHPDGNVLRRLGFRREAAPPGRRRAVTRYVRSGPDDVVALWPFALCVADGDGTVLVPRRGRASWSPLAARPDVHDLDGLHAVRQAARPCGARGLSRVCAWLGGHERAVAALVGTGHRAPAEARSRAAPGDPYDLADAWTLHAVALATAGGD